MTAAWQRWMLDVGFWMLVITGAGALCGANQQPTTNIQNPASAFRPVGGRPPLVDAARNGDRDALRTLLQKNVDVNAADADGSTALHWSSYRDDVESAGLLIRAGAKVNVANDLGVTPLWTASLNGSTAMVRRLLESGANPNAALLAGETPVM